MDEQEICDDYIIKKMSMINIAKKYNSSKFLIKKVLLKHNIKIRSLKKKLEDLKSPHGIKILSEEKRGNIYWLECICHRCFNKFYSPKYNITKGITRSCGCLHHRLKIDSIHWKGYEEISGTFLDHIKQASKKRNLIFEITLGDIWEFYINQNKKCALSGLNIEFDTTHTEKKRRCSSASIDRIDSGKGYMVSNTWLVHKDINKIKQNLFLDEFLCWCALISNPIPNLTHDHKYNTNKIDEAYLLRLKNDAKLRKKEFNISKDYIWDLYKKQNGKCALTNINIYFTRKLYKCSELQTASLDRINSNIGYIKENLQWIHKKVNTMKQNLDQDYFINLCKLINNYRIING